MSKRNGRIAAITIAAFVGVTPVLTAGAAFAQQKPPTDSTQSQYPGGCVDLRTGTDYTNGSYRTDDNGTTWKCRNGKWYTTVSSRAGRMSGGDRVAPPMR